jgi:hypothetical protein
LTNLIFKVSSALGLIRNVAEHRVRQRSNVVMQPVDLVVNPIDFALDLDNPLPN